VWQEISIKRMGKENVSLVDEVPCRYQYLPGTGAGNSEGGKFGENFRIVSQYTINHACPSFQKKETTTGSAKNDLVPVGRRGAHSRVPSGRNP
jgi:hypothetical protein